LNRKKEIYLDYPIILTIRVQANYAPLIWNDNICRYLIWWSELDTQNRLWNSQ